MINYSRVVWTSQLLVIISQLFRLNPIVAIMIKVWLQYCSIEVYTI